MTTFVRERLGEQSLTGRGGVYSGTRIFTVYDDASTLTLAQVYSLIGTTTTPDQMPQPGDAFPGTILEATDPDIRQAPDTQDMWIVRWTFTNQADTIGWNQTQPLDAGYVDVSADINAELRDQWRVFTKSQMLALVAVGGTNASGAAADTDIAGTSVDVAGEPLSCVQRTIKLSVGVTKSALPILGSLSTFTGKRNSTVFWGAPIGSVLFTGSQVSRSALQRWRVTYEFVLDDAYHMRQQPLRFPDGTVKLNAIFGDADKVYHAQPFPDLVDFYSIDPAFTGKV